MISSFTYALHTVVTHMIEVLEQQSHMLYAIVIHVRLSLQQCNPVSDYIVQCANTEMVKQVWYFFSCGVTLYFCILLSCCLCFSGILSMKCMRTLMLQRLDKSLHERASPPYSILLQTFSCWQKVTILCAPSLPM